MSAKDFSEVAALAKRKTAEDLKTFTTALYLQNILIGIAEVLNALDGRQNGAGHYIVHVIRTYDNGGYPIAPNKPPAGIKDVLEIDALREIVGPHGRPTCEVARFIIRNDAILDCTDSCSSKDEAIIRLNGRQEFTEQELNLLYDRVRERIAEALPSHIAAQLAAPQMAQPG